MGDYCLTENGVITNIVIAESEDALAPLKLYPCYKDAAVGEHYRPPLPPYTHDELTQQIITDLYLSDIEHGQEATALLLEQIAQGQDMTDIQIMMLEGAP